MKTIDELKTHPEAYRIYASRVKLLRSGDGWLGKCPFHDDNRESFSVFQQDGCWLWKCHAKDGTGNCVQFLAKFTNCTIRQACKQIEQELSDGWAKEHEDVEKVFKPLPTKTLVTFAESDYIAAEQKLLKSREALAYLASRGIPVEVARKLRIGFKQDVGKMCGQRNDDIADKGWLVFPSFENGRVVSIKYRSIVRKEFCRQAGMKTSVWNTDRIDLFEPVFITEGELDAASMEAAGFRAISLASASTPVGADDLAKIAASSAIYLAGDVDGAENGRVGQKAMDRLAASLPSAKRIIWPNGAKDANDVLMKQCGGDAKSFRSVVESLVTQAIVSPMPGV